MSIGVLRERGELSAESVMDGARKRIERRIVLARLLVDARRVGRKLVVEAVEQDSLTSRDQPLDVRPAKVEMPSLRILQLVVPVADARQRRVHHHPSGHALRNSATSA